MTNTTEKTIKIKSDAGDIFEFETLDKALRALTGVVPGADRYEQPLLTSPSRRTFKEAQGLLNRNGYSLLTSAPTLSGIIEQNYPQVADADQAIADAFNASIKLEEEKKGVAIKIEAKKTTPAEGAAAWEFMAKQLIPFIPVPEVEIDAEQIKQDLQKDITEKIQKTFEGHIKEIVITKKETGEVKNVGHQHYNFETLLMTIAARINAILVGPAGSGKTSAAHNAATALGLNFYSVSVGLQTTKTEFFGYNDANGKYVSTLFRKAFEHGGVFLIDEMDAGNANVLTAINQALANGSCAFPDGMVSKHPDFIVVASANTYGSGANRDYVGRNQLDAATLDRFAFIDWDYDTDLEAALCPNKTWLAFVRKCRKNAELHKIRVVISPRASIFGAQLLAQGLPLETVKQMVIFKGINATEKSKLTEGI